MTSFNFILELGVEEIPASYFGPALTFLVNRITKDLGAMGLPFDKLKTWSGPRRLALGIWGLSDRQLDLTEEIIGPPLTSAFDANGNHTKAALGFAKGQEVSVSDLFTLNTPKGPYLAVRKSREGRPTALALTETVPKILEALPFPKVMRWGEGDYQFVRPVHWLLAVFAGEILPITFCGIRAGKVSYGHRFLHPGPVVVVTPDEYPSRLAETHVLADYEERKNLVKQEIVKAAALNADLVVNADEDLVAEVANLLEEPVAILGHFDSHFLELPAAVATTAMKERQRYFPVTDDQGRQAPYFVAVNNTRATDLDVVRKGHERVLRARLEDARFYFQEDRKVKLADRMEDLKGVVFHHLLGTSWDKVQRFKELAKNLAAQTNPDQKSVVARAADLCKCDLVSGVVGEFPTLQGLMGYEYALADGEDPIVAKAILEHYLPIRAGGELPTTAAGAILSVADKLDTIVGCFGVGLLPTGAADPFGLRRQALGIILIILDQKWTWSLEDYVEKALLGLGSLVKTPAKEVRQKTLEFFKTRLKSHLLALGVAPDTAEAVLGLYGDKPPAAVGRALALEDLKRAEGFRDLAQTFKRVVNIIKKFGYRDEDPPIALLTHPAETDLLRAAEVIKEDGSELIRQGDYPGLLNQVATLKGPVDLFFDQVLVDDPNPDLKNARVALLAKVSQVFELAADFSKVSAV
ncbi:MAG: glycine--tRNA ligase subunit beta [Deltaproteobacteria bacterium]|jgi:glycyl-tRNA synthetase beta chain|nr:glycine--tRNA ligase subunit beta [Deltaproteobacteria bacterium]